MGKEKKIYLGLDIGTDSVGYAVTDESYNLRRFHGSDAWGSIVFDSGSTKADRRGYRSARRRLDRRQQRVKLLQEIFAAETAKVDPRFFIRLTESYLWREDTKDRYIFFNDDDYTDVQYMKDYPTIHHLICELMENREPHDVRLVYLACAWLVAHRGHFLNNIRVEKIDELTDIHKVYDDFKQFFLDNEYSLPWNDVDENKLAEILKKKTGVNNKKAELAELLLQGAKPAKNPTDTLPFSQASIISLLAGGTVKPKDLFAKEEYEELASFSLDKDEEVFLELMGNIGEDYELIRVLRNLYDWSVLAELLSGKDGAMISAAKKQIYEQHKEDLVRLKYFIRKYVPEKYNTIFRDELTDNYVAYIDGVISGNTKKHADLDSFSKFVLKQIEKIEVSPEDETAFADMKNCLTLRTFLPKQKNTDNRVIPRQLYEYELQKILNNAKEYLPFLNNKDDDGLSNADKIISIFEFKVPYYVGPLNARSDFAWLKKKEGKITPWNFKELVDDDASEEAFIKKLTNSCTYLPNENVLPKDSLCYQAFMVLNEINNLRINNHKIPVDLKQKIYSELFEKHRSVKRKDIEKYLTSIGAFDSKNDELGGIDDKIKSSLASHYAFRNLLASHKLTEADVERIIERASYAEDKSRVAKWLRREFPMLSDEDQQYICKIKVKDFGRLSKRLLTELEGVSKETGEVTTILRAMWETNDNLMEILSDKYTFAENIRNEKENYYSNSGVSLEKRLDEMYVSNAVRRPIYRTLAIAKDVEKAFGKPDKIFIEMTRGGQPDKKGKRTKSRYEQLLELYGQCKDETVKELKAQLDAMGERVENKLQADKLFLYFLQMGKCAYSGTPIILERLMTGDKLYDIEHIYPRAYVKDDSIINNKVLVLSKLNGEKSDEYPIRSEIRQKMHGIWTYWHNNGNINDEKYKRLTRSTPFTDEERYGFINRQLTETSQSTKAVAEILKERYPDAEIVYSKAGMVSEFRQEYELFKSRSYNDLHHAIDAYLNVVVGNVYHMRFNRKWFNTDQNYSIKTKTMFSSKKPLIIGGNLVWDSDVMLPMVIRNAQKNSAHFVKYATFKRGGLFDQNPVAKAEGLIPIKKGLPTEKYGGYNKAGAMFFIPTAYKQGKKSEVVIMSVEMLHGKHFIEDEDFAKEYAYTRLRKILGKPVDEVAFPMGMRPWKVNTMLSLDGFRVCITGMANGGKLFLLQPVMQFSSDAYWNFYLKKIERFIEKNKSNSHYVYDEEYDVVSIEKNNELYSVYLRKGEDSIYAKRPNLPLDILVNGQAKFEELDVLEQCKTLMAIHSSFSRTSGGCDLSAIGGSKKSAVSTFGIAVSNWKKNYSDIRIIDQSPSGLWERKSINLLELV